jgi:hypothetical protein
MKHSKEEDPGRAVMGRAIQRAIGPAMSGVTGESLLPKGVDRFMTSDGELFLTSDNKQYNVTRS